MKSIKELIHFFTYLFKKLNKPKYIISTRMDFLNASEILYIHNTEDIKTGFWYMHIKFASHQHVSVLFHNKEAYDSALKQLIISN